jgi:hypothetical protein
MGKEVRGWREPQTWDYKGEDIVMKTMDRSTRSDEGWLCPHCEAKEMLENSEMPSQDVFSLILNSEPIKVYCNNCNKDYYVKCFTRFSYYSCVDESFEQD